MEAENHRYSGFEFVLYIIILPLLFTALLSGIILQFFGFDVTGKIADAARAVPVVGEWLPEEDPDKDLTPEEKLAKAKGQVETLEAGKTQMQEELAKKDAEIERLNKQIEEMKEKKKKEAEKAEADANTAAVGTGEVAEEEKQPEDPVEVQAKVFAEMSASKAALVMSKLSVTEAKLILAKMTFEEQAAILQNMKPEIAGQIVSQ